MNSTFGLKQGDLEVIRNILEKYHKIEKAVIFGSRVSANYRPGSDVDIAIFTNDKNTASELSYTLNEDTLLPYSFDIIDFNSLAHKNLATQIKKTGIIIYER